VTDSLVYNIPARQIDAYRACSVIIRSSAPEEIAYHLRRPLKAPVLMIQLLGTPADTGVLEALGANIPIEIVLADPVAEYAQLYNYANLLDTHPVRVAVPVLPGFSKAARLAVSLDFAVKLEAHQPDEPLIQELMSVLGLYLHRNTVRQPIELKAYCCRSIGTTRSRFGRLPTKIQSLCATSPMTVRRQSRGVSSALI
jgi:hypothetical protein